MEQSQDYIDDLIIQSLTGTLGAESQEELQRWASSTAEHGQYFNQKRELWFSAIDSQRLNKYDGRRAFENFRLRVNAAQASKLSNENTFHISRLVRYAASVAILCVMGWGAYHYGQSSLAEEFSEITVEAPMGSHTYTLLPDGTKVWLNAGSKLSYSQGFGIKDRRVKLAGEGFFEVKTNNELPFCVSTGNLQVNDLGTQFNLRDYTNDTEAEVVLTEGSVSLDNLIKKDSPRMMIPGDRIILNKITGQLTQDRLDTQGIRLWTSGQLNFNGESIDIIAKKLERAYNIKVRISSDSLENFHFYGSFAEKENSLKDILNALAATGKLHYSIEKNHVTLY